MELKFELKIIVCDAIQKFDLFSNLLFNDIGNNFWRLAKEVRKMKKECFLGNKIYVSNIISIYMSVLCIKKAKSIEIWFWDKFYRLFLDMINHDFLLEMLLYMLYVYYNGFFAWLVFEITLFHSKFRIFI